MTENKEYLELQHKGSDWSYGSKWGDQMENAILEWFSKELPLDAKILDAGCGEGRGVKSLLDAGFKNVSGVDLTPEKVEAGKSKGLNLFLGDLHSLETIQDKEYDYVFCSHTLEHMMDLPKAISNLVRITKHKIFYIIPIHETKEFVTLHNPSHTSVIGDASEFYSVLDKLNLNHKHWEVTRMSDELWGIIYV
jgi:2-polyprenyl-3-methyl-5-hydroxy-6-metoxy-1,4-benzoquinol methylase